MSTVRLRRLTSDSAKLQEYVRRHPRVRLIQMEGDPPERYQIEYRINSLRMVDGELRPVQSHLVEVTLPLNYPRTPPQCRMLSPVFHPNIAPHAICVGDHWGAGESLESIIIRIGEMLAYQSYNVKSPLNGEAARWVEENKDRIPLDLVSLLPEDEKTADQRQTVAMPPRPPMPKSRTTSPVPPSQGPPKTGARDANTITYQSAATPSDKVEIKCPACGAGYRVPAAVIGRDVRCTKCSHTFKCQPISKSNAAPEAKGN
jgi:predicted Zn finger-like uncharacterized protein